MVLRRAVDDLEARQVAAGIEKLIGAGAGDAIKKGLTNGVGAALGGTAISSLFGNNKRELETREPLGAVGKGLLGTGVGLIGSGIAQDAIDGVKSLFDRRDDLTADEEEQLNQILAAHLASRSTSLNDLD